MLTISKFPSPPNPPPAPPHPRSRLTQLTAHSAPPVACVTDISESFSLNRTLNLVSKTSSTRLSSIPVQGKVTYLLSFSYPTPNPLSRPRTLPLLTAYTAALLAATTTMCPLHRSLLTGLSVQPCLHVACSSHSSRREPLHPKSDRADPLPKPHTGKAILSQWLSEQGPGSLQLLCPRLPSPLCPRHSGLLAPPDSQHVLADGLPVPESTVRSTGIAMMAATISYGSLLISHLQWGYSYPLLKTCHLPIPRPEVPFTQLYIFSFQLPSLFTAVYCLSLLEYWLHTRAEVFK